MAKRSFIDECSAHRPRKRTIPWPLGGDAKVVVRILSDDDREAAYFAVVDHFKAIKRKIDHKDPAFENRERVELVWRAFRTDEDEPIAASADELAKEPGELIGALYLAWAEYQREAAAKPIDEAAVRELVDHLKKNMPAEALAGLPSTWLIAVITTLVGQLSTSATTKADGS